MLANRLYEVEKGDNGYNTKSGLLEAQSTQLPSNLFWLGT